MPATPAFPPSAQQPAPFDTTTRILVGGADTWLGRELVSQLLELNYWVCGLIASPAAVEHSKAGASSVGATSARSAATSLFPEIPTYRHSALEVSVSAHAVPFVPAHFSDVSVAYYLFHLDQTPGGKQCASRECAGAFLKMAQQAGVQRVVVVTEVTSPAPDFGAVPPGLEVLTLSASLVLGARTPAFRALRDIALRLPCLVVNAECAQPLYPLSLEDACAALTTAIELTPRASGLFTLHGSERVSISDLLAMIHRSRCRTVPTYTLPWLGTTQLALGARLISKAPLSALQQGLAAQKGQEDLGVPSIWPSLGLRPQVPLLAALLDALSAHRYPKSLRGAASFLAEAAVQVLGRALTSTDP